MQDELHKAPATQQAKRLAVGAFSIVVLIVAVALGQIAANRTRQLARPDLERRLQAVAAKLNQELRTAAPQGDTRFDRTSAGPGALLTFYYTFQKFPGVGQNRFDMFDGLEERIAAFRAERCAEDSVASLVRDGVDVVYVYSDRGGKRLYDVKVTKATCSALESGTNAVPSIDPSKVAGDPEPTGQRESGVDWSQYTPLERPLPAKSVPKITPVDYDPFAGGVEFVADLERLVPGVLTLNATSLDKKTLGWIGGIWEVNLEASHWAKRFDIRVKRAEYAVEDGSGEPRGWVKLLVASESSALPDAAVKMLVRKSDTDAFQIVACAVALNQKEAMRHLRECNGKLEKQLSEALDARHKQREQVERELFGEQPQS